MKRMTLVAGLLLGLVGCVRLTDSVPPGQVALNRDAQLFVACFLSPQDTLLTVKVADVATLTDPAPIGPLGTARVILRRGSDSLRFSYNATTDYYQAPRSSAFPIQGGATYQLSVATNGGRRVQAEATIPPPVPISRARIDSVVTNQPGGGRVVRYAATLEWTSPPGTSYYRGWGMLKLLVSAGSGKAPMVVQSQPNFPVLRGTNTDPEPYSTTGIVSLTLAAGETVRTQSVRLGLFNTDANYFQYQTALQEQLLTTPNAFGNGPVLFSNIRDGFGVFAAYNATYIALPTR